MMSLKKQGAMAIKWTSLSTIVVAIIQFIQLIVLSRLLDSTSYGLMGMIMVVVGFAQIYSDVGISNALMYKQNITQEKLSSLYVLNIMSGVLVYIIIVCISPLISYFYNESRILLPLIIVSLIFVIIPIGQQFQVLLQKELKFNILAKVDIIAVVSGFISAIIFAVLGYGVYALVGAQLTIAIIRAALLLSLGRKLWVHRLHFRLEDTKEFISFGLYQMGEKTLHYFSSNIDYLLIGRFFGAEALGYYNIAYQLIIIPVQRINPIVTQVAVPLFSKLQYEKERLQKGYITVINYLSLVNFPLYFLLFSTAPVLIPFVFGEQWTNSIPLVQILCAMGLVRSTISPNTSLSVATGRAELGFYWTIISMVILIPCISFGAYLYEVRGIAIGFVVAQVILAIINYNFFVKKLIGYCSSEYISAQAIPFIYCIIMAISVVGLSFLTKDVNDITQISIQIISGVVMYGILNYTLGKRKLMDIVDLLMRRERRSEQNSA